MPADPSPLAQARALGPYFTVDEVGAAASSYPSGLAWRPFASLLTTDAALLRAQVERVRRGLAGRAGLEVAAVEARVAASIWLLGVAARLVSPPFGAAALAGCVPRVALSSVEWAEVDGGPLPLRLVGPIKPIEPIEPGVTTSAVQAEELAALVHEGWIEPLVRPLVEAVGSAYRLSLVVLWGDVASAVGGALAVTAARLGGPDAGRARAIAAAALGQGDLRGTADLLGSGLRRHSCCLLYRVPGAGLCGDCVLRHTVSTDSAE